MHIPQMPPLARRAAIALALALATLGTACSDGGPTAPPQTGEQPPPPPPPPPAPVTVALTGPAQVTAALHDGSVHCDYVVSLAVAGGAAGTKVALKGLTLEWLDLNGAPYGDEPTLQVPASELAGDWFHATEVATGSTVVADRWVGTAPHVSFKFRITARWQAPGQAEQSSQYTLTCM